MLRSYEECACVYVWGGVGASNSKTQDFSVLSVSFLGVPPYPRIPLHHPAGLFSCFSGTSGRSEFPMDLITLHHPGRRQDGHHLPDAFLSQRGSALPGKVGLNTDCPVPVQYLSGRGSSEESEVIVFPVALVMPPPSYSHRFVYLVEVRGTWCYLPRKTKCLHLVGTRTPENASSFRPDLTNHK